MSNTKKIRDLASKALQYGKTITTRVAMASKPVLQKAKIAVGKVQDEVVPGAIKSSSEIYARLKKDYGPGAASAFDEALRRSKKFTPGEVGSTALGAATGATVGGYIIGGSIGVVGIPIIGAIGLPWAIILAIVFASAGNRIGVGFDKAEIERKKKERDEKYIKLLEQYEKSLNDKGKKSVNVLKIHSPAEHAELLRKALRNAKHTVIILCGWVTDYVIDDEFKLLLEGCLSRGVNVYIGYGYTASNEKKPSSEVQLRAENYLFNELKPWCYEKNTKGHLWLVKYPNHAKVLIRDYEYAVVGSFNWLSNSGRSKNAEYSWVIKDMDFVEKEADIIIGELKSFIPKREFLKKFHPWLHH
jgi:hypothetical protein